MYHTDFDEAGLYVIYSAGFPQGTPSDCVWLIPGTWIDDD
jgi:hypothetical protein